MNDYDTGKLLLDVAKLKETGEKYKKDEPVKIDEKYMKALEDVYKMEEEFDDFFVSDQIPGMDNNLLENK